MEDFFEVFLHKFENYRVARSVRAYHYQYDLRLGDADVALEVATMELKDAFIDAVRHYTEK